MRIRTIFFVRCNSDIEEKGIMIQTLTSEFILDEVGQTVGLFEVKDYRVATIFIANIDMNF